MQLLFHIVVGLRFAIIQAVQKKDTQQIIDSLLEKQHAFEIRMYVLIGVVLFLVVLFAFLCYLNSKGDTRLQKIIQILEKQQHAKKQSDECLALDEEIVSTILDELRQFEQEKGFLLSKITLHQFAKNIQTNTKYLSKVINTYKLKSFRNYINDLRIQHSIEQLENDAQYRNYTVKAMAKASGFGTVNSFTNAFQKRTGETVSTFLKQQEQD